MTYGSHASRTLSTTTLSTTSRGALPRPARALASLGVIGLCAALLAGPVAAGPKIDTTGATIATGSAASRGQVVIDENAAAATAPAIPGIGPLGGVGTFSAPMPDMRRPPVRGAAFVAFDSMTLPAGEYEFASYDVTKDAVVTYDGPVTLRVGGDVTILGRVEARPGSGALRIESGGGLSLGAGASIGAGAFEAVVIDTIGSITAAPGSSISSPTNSVAIRAHGLAGDILLDGTSIDGSDVVLKASGGIFATGASSVSMASGFVRIAAYGGDVEFSGGSAISLTAAPLGVYVEASHAIVFRDAGSGVHATSAPVRMRAFHGPLSLTAGADIRLTVGSIDLGALGTVTIGSDAGTTITSGPVSVASFGGDVELSTGPGRPLGTIGGNQCDVVLTAAGNVVVDGAGDAIVSNRTVRVTAQGGDVGLLGGAGVHAGGGLTILAGRSVVAPHLRVTAAGAAFGAQTGTIGLPDLQFSGAFDGAGLLAVSSGTLTIGGSIVSGGPVHLASRSGNVDVSGCDLSTASVFGADAVSAPVTIESLAGATGGIDAAGATIRTGDGSLGSGDVSLLVHDAEIVEPAEGFLSPSSVSLRRTASSSTLTVAGFLDAGPAPFAAGTAELTVGDVTVPIVLAATGTGRLSVRGADHSLDLRAVQAGSSRRAFQLRWTGPVSGFLSSDGGGPLTVGLAQDGRSAQGTVGLSMGRYRAGRIPGTLTLPDLAVTRLTGRLPGIRPGSLSLSVGVGSVLVVPAMPPDLGVTVGDRFSVLVPGTAFREDTVARLTAVRPAPGVLRVVYDVHRQTVTVDADDADLRAADGSVPDRLVVGVSFGDVERKVAVRVRNAGKRLVY